MPKKFAFLLAYASVFFLSFFIIFRTAYPPLPKEDAALLFYSNQCQSDLRLTLLDAIREAKKSIYLVMFGLSDLPILSALAEKSKEGIAIEIYYDPRGSAKIERYLRGVKLHPITHQGLMHQKIIVIDHRLVFLGSANMTSASLKMHDNLIVGFMNEPFAHFLEETAPLRSGYKKEIICNQELEVWLLPDKSGKVLDSLCQSIRNAKSSIRLALFTYTHPLLVEEVLAAFKRGVDVQLVVDMHSSLGASAKSIQLLSREGIAVFVSQGVQLMHHKFLWIDEETLFTGSANWTKAAFEKNSDYLVAIHGLSGKQRAFMKKLWKQLKEEGKRLARTERA